MSAMKIPKEIKEFYDSLENMKSLNIWNISNELKTCDLIKSTLWRKKIITERKVLFYNLNGGELHPNTQSTDINGGIEKSLNFSKSEIFFLIERLNQTNNNWLKSRYAHILWNETKNNTYALIAIDNYMICLNMIKGKEAREIDIILNAILYLSKKTKQRTEESRKLALELIECLPTWFKFTILNSAMRINFFNSADLNFVANKVFEWFEKQTPINYFNNKSNLEIVLLLFEKIKRPNEKIYELLALNQDSIIAQHEEESFVKLTALSEKAVYLKKAKQFEEYENILRECTRIKQKTKLHKVSVELDEDLNSMFNDYLKMKSQFILTWSTESILSFFSLNDEVLVDPKEVDELANKNVKNSIRSLFTTSIFDINSNTRKLTEKEVIDFEKLQTYVIAHNIKVYTLFLKVFIDGIITGKLNYYKIFNFLEEHTWYGMKFRKSLKNNEEDQNSTWLSLLAPGIHNFLAQFELSTLMNTNKINNFILAIDSMTLKFEGALRDFIRLSGGNTMLERKGDMQEQLLEDLLENEVTKKYFSEKDIELFKYTFTKKGKNIRNNVAHSFMEFSDYNLQTASLVFLCILRLGKYTFKDNV